MSLSLPTNLSISTTGEEEVGCLKDLRYSIRRVVAPEAVPARRAVSEDYIGLLVRV
jgi:hypothetical protein